MERFTIPRDVYYEKGSMEILKELKGEKASIVVGGSSMQRTGFLDKTRDLLEQAGMATQIIDGVEPDPSVETVIKGAKMMQEFQPDWIVSIGGGSPIDAAKAMWIFYEHPNAKFEDIAKPFNIPELRKKAKFAAIPSTSGTASEVTAFSVITDYKEGIKYPLADFKITPDIAILDPEIAYEMPQKLTAHTGIDALTHATEAITASQASDFSDPLALKAIRMVKDHLLESHQGNQEDRDRMHIAQCLAGMAFSNALLGICHSMAHKTGAMFGIPHGCANGIYLPYVIAYNRKAAESKYAEIARYIGLEGKNDQELCDAYIRFIVDLNKQLNIPNSLKEYGVDEQAFYGKLDAIAANAANDACTFSNPRETNVQDLKELFKAAYHGTSYIN
ncbi:MAG TPA: iron-containing alcohol dehydrogenase [Bacteroidales bacterium]|nr:iron-containing alcohol dehydrogenase [Bacteroidales bacterium]